MNSKTTVAYDTWHEQMEAGSINGDPLAFPWYRSAFEGIKQGLRGDLLEVGCGRGEFAVWLAGLLPDLRITGVDFSSAAVTFSRRRALTIPQSIRFVIGDAQCLSFPDNSFDWIVSCECMEHVPNPRAMAAEIFRVLRPSGRFCLTTENYLNGMLLAWVKSWITGRSFDSGSGIQPIENFFLFSQVRKYLRDAGLMVDRTESSHYQWLLIPRVDPAQLCTREFKSRWARRFAKPFGRHFSFFGYKP